MTRSDFSLRRRGLMLAATVAGTVPGWLVPDVGRAEYPAVPDAGAAVGRPAVISGRVVAADGSPVTNASVAFRYSSSSETSAPAAESVLTDADGRFFAVMDRGSAARLYCCVSHERSPATVARIDPGAFGADVNALSGLRDESGVWRNAVQIELS